MISTATDEWTRVYIDLDSYVGQSPVLSFQFISDGTIEGDGVYLDDINVTKELIPTKADIDLRDMSFTRPADDSSRKFTGLNIRYMNNGPDSVINAPVRMDFFLSKDNIYGNGNDEWIGLITSQTITIQSGIGQIVTYSPGTQQELDDMTEFWFPREVSSGDYYLGVRLNFPDWSPVDTYNGNNVVFSGHTFHYTAPSGNDSGLPAINLLLLEKGVL